MKVILTESVDRLGDAGEIVDVKPRSEDVV